MDTRRLGSWILLAGIALLGACNGDGTGTFPPGLLTQGFRVLYSDPQWNAEYVPTSNKIVVKFSAPLNEASVAAAVSVKQMSGAAITEVEGSLSLADSDSTLVFTPNELYLPDAKITMDLSPSLQSKTSESLPSTQVVFWTGAAGSMTGNSVAGAPKIVSFDHVENPAYGFCLAYIAEFNEDLSTAPQARAEAEGLFGLIPSGTTWLYAQMLYQDSPKTWLLTYPDGGCSCDNFGVDTKIEVQVNNAVDLQGERMSGTYTKKYHGWDFAMPPACY